MSDRARDKLNTNPGPAPNRSFREKISSFSPISSPRSGSTSPSRSPLQRKGSAPTSRKSSFVSSEASLFRKSSVDQVSRTSGRSETLSGRSDRSASEESTDGSTTPGVLVDDEAGEPGKNRGNPSLTSRFGDVFLAKKL